MKRELISAMTGLLMFAGSASAQESWPTKPITLVMPYAVGGGADLMARVLADSLSKTLGQPVRLRHQPTSAVSAPCFQNRRHSAGLGSFA